MKRAPTTSIELEPSATRFKANERNENEDEDVSEDEEEDENHCNTF